MTPRAIHRLLAGLVARSEERNDWARASRFFKARASGFECDVRLRVHLICQEIGGRARLTGEIRVELLNVGGLESGETGAGLNFGAFKSEFDTLLPLYEATFAAAGAQLASNAAFQALGERAELIATTERAPTARPASRRL